MATCTYTVNVNVDLQLDDHRGTVATVNGNYQSSIFDLSQAGAFESLINDLLQNAAMTLVDYAVTETISGGQNNQLGYFTFTADSDTEVPGGTFFFSAIVYGGSTGWNAIPSSSCDTVTACPDCLEKNFAACAASYTITTGLTAATEYMVVLTDVNEIRYTQLITTDGSGNLTIDTTDFPAGAFTPEFGGFTMEVYSDSELTTPVDITVGSLTYGCVKLRFQHTVTTTSYIPPVFSFLVTDQLDYIVTETGDTFICN